MRRYTKINKENMSAILSNPKEYLNTIAKEDHNEKFKKAEKMGINYFLKTGYIPRGKVREKMLKKLAKA